MSSATIFQIQSFLIMSFMFYGIYAIKVLKNRVKHIRVMQTAIIWDVFLILQIELSRGAIKKASAIITNPLLLKIHLFFAISSVVLYGIMYYTGRKIVNGENKVIKRHKYTGMVTMLFRILTFVTSFYAVAPLE